MRYNSNYRSRSKKGRNFNALSFLMPFIILICLGVIIILVIRLISTLTQNDLSKGVKFDVVAGEVQVKSWGTDTFVDFKTGSYLMEGDEIKTTKDSKVIMEFEDGSIVRLDDETDLIVDTMDFEKDSSVKLMLVDGQIWVNKSYKDTSKTLLTIDMGHIVLRSNDSSIFSLQTNMDETVRVLNGKSVFVDVMSENSEDVVETVTVAVGQEAQFNNEILAQFWNFDSPSIVEPFSDEFRDGKFYSWNLSEDKRPSSLVDGELDSELGNVVEDGLVSVDPEALNGEVVGPVVDKENVDANLDPVVEVVPEEKPVVDVSSSLATPKLVNINGASSPNDFGLYVVTSHLATITGSISGASAVYVNDYKLSKFLPGNTTWTYFANADYDLMTEGENIFNVYAVDANGKKSQILTFKVFYKPEVVVAPAPVVEPTPVVEETAPVEPAPVEPAVPVVEEPAHL